MNSITMNYDDASERLDRVFAALHEAVIQREIKEPIDRAFDTFIRESSSLFQQNDVVIPTAVLIQQIDRKAIKPHHGLTDSKVQVEAFNLLDRFYQGKRGTGYLAAMIDYLSQDIQDKMAVLGQVADIIKTQRKETYIRGVFWHSVLSLSNQTKSAMVQALMTRYAPVLSPEILQTSPSQLIDELPQLIQLCLKVDAQFLSIISS